MSSQLPAAELSRLTPSPYRFSRLDMAFRLLAASLDQDLPKTITNASPSTWHPAFFVLMGDLPTDEYGKPSRQWESDYPNVIAPSRGYRSPRTIIPVQCGTSLDVQAISGMSTAGVVAQPNDVGALMRLISVGS